MSSSRGSRRSSTLRNARAAPLRSGMHGRGPGEFNYDLAARRAAHIAFPQAVPKKAVITSRGLPLHGRCPAAEAPWLHLARSGRQGRRGVPSAPRGRPAPRRPSRACYAPCEEECSRAELEGTVSIRGIKRFIADHYYASHPTPEYGPPKDRRGKNVGIVGSGPPVYRRVLSRPGRL